ncbi:unnamed protein product [Rhizoctonia solani]|uniref:Uncharacterized protein n=1 Tax=Rhizoctonia solani TaxID=456999 RepID=A0A8H2ZYJ6_9AGAM|nr:unnamed protein product [Rhizoctonia solani]
MPVTLSSGLYKIFTETPSGRLYAGILPDSAPDTTGGLPVVAGPESSAQGNEVIAVPNREVGEWIVTGGRNPEKYRIFTPQSKLYWTTTQEGTSGAPIALRELEADENGINDWDIEFQRNSE